MHNTTVRQSSFSLKWLKISVFDNTRQNIHFNRVRQKISGLTRSAALLSNGLIMASSFF
jgi:hypothetical protein